MRGKGKRRFPKMNGGGQGLGPGQRRGNRVEDKTGPGGGPFGCPPGYKKKE